jgi:tetratricopeptide (TPR) repeat protein/TolB-like protein
MAKSFFSELLRRRVPQFLGVYLAAGWAALEFTDFLVNRYVLSTNLTDFVLLTWALLVPTILMLAWYHGAPGRDQWTTTERVGIPLNIVLAVVLLFVVFRGSDLGAATTSVAVETEEGKTVERVVPKSEFRKHLAVFFFDNESADSALDWLQYGITWGLVEDLMQDVFIDIRTPNPSVEGELGMVKRLRNAGYADGLRVPFALKRQISDELHRDHFLAGTIGSSDGQLTVTTQLYDTSRGKLIEERTYAGDDPLSLVDRISTQVRLDLEVPSQHVEETRDLPVSELHTESRAAYRSFVEAIRGMTVDDDWQGAASHLEEAVAEDPTYASAHLTRFGVYLFLNQSEAAVQALQSAMDHSYKLTERAQFLAKVNYYTMLRQESEKAKAVAGMWSELYPDDIVAHALLAQLHMSDNEIERAIEDLRRVLDLDPGQYEVLTQIGNLYRISGEFDAAEDYYRQYADQFPDDPQSFAPLGELSTARGDHEAARGFHERAQMLDPDDASLLADLAWAEYDLGNFDRAFEHLENALSVSSTAAQRATSHDALLSYYHRRGRLRLAVDHMHAYWAELRASRPPAMVLIQMFTDIETYVDAGMTQAALDTMASIKSQLAPPLDQYARLGDLQIALASDDMGLIEEALSGFDSMIEVLGFEFVRFFHVYGRGRVLELQGDCEQAIIAYGRAIEMQPTAENYHIDVGRCQRKLGDHAAAEASLERTLTVSPYSARARLELAKVYQDMGEADKAIEQLRTALRIWENADPGYAPAAEARELMARLGE